MPVRCVFVLWLLAALAFAGCARRAPVSVPRRTVAQAIEQTSATCARCHAEIHAGWATTDHALANRPIDPARDQAAFTVSPVIEDGGSRFEIGWDNHHPSMTEIRPGTPPIAHQPDLMLGSKPLRQPLLPAAGGRWQPTDLAFDPVKHEWFNVFGQERRQPGEWGHWTGRGMNWNSMCAQCHMTGYQKNYSAATDSYASKWVEHGVGCIQCHGPMPTDHNNRKSKIENPKSAEPFSGDRSRIMQTCAPCHGRNEALTASFQPGDNYDDHYRVTLPVDAAVFYPDGQQRDEDFNWTSIRLSRMGHAGVTCLDCHDPHTNQTILPATDNRLCLRCHSAPTPVAFSKAPVIDPVAHSHHAATSTGNQCVTCHMPTTTYMQRAPRHDHGWLRPDPLLTKELGIPNACNRCHTDQSVEWSIGKTDAWYGTKLDSHQRARTRAVAAAQAHQPNAAEALLSVFTTEDIPAWRATLLDLASPDADASAEIVAGARTSLAANDPLERAAAVRALTAHAESQHLLRPLLHDPVRLVRLDAEWALSASLADGSPERAELDAYLSLTLDQPSGRLRLGQDLANRGRLAEAQKEMELAAQWDLFSPGIRDALGFVFNSEGNSLQAAAQFFRSAQLQPHDAAAAYRAALAFAEAGQLSDAELAFRLTVDRDPKFDRAWYNLGLLLAKIERFADASAALQTAESIAPGSPDYPYAQATVLLRSGDREGALAAARRALAADPNYTPARELLQSRR